MIYKPFYGIKQAIKRPFVKKTPKETEKGAFFFTFYIDTVSERKETKGRYGYG